MRILHTDTDDLENPLRGGQPVRTYEVNSRLTAAHEVTVLTATYRACIRETIRSGVRYRRLGVTIPGSGLSPHLSFLASLPVAVRRIPHDLLVEEFTPPVGFCMLPRFSRRPVVSIVQWFFFRDWERRYKLPFESLMRRLARRAGYRNFIVQTDRMGDYFRELLPQAAVWKVPCGIGDEAFEAGQGDGDYALFLGRLDVNHKGLDHLIDAWVELARSGMSIPLKIVGAGPGDAWLREAVAEKGLTARVEMVGRLEGEAKRRLLRGCRFLVMPSRQETFGIAALEAMAAARPVIAFDIDHLNELVGPSCGERVPAGNVAAFANAAARLWREPARARELGHNGFGEARSYHWDQIAERQLAIYQEVVERGRAA